MGTSVDRLDHADRSPELTARIVAKITQPIIDPGIDPDVDRDLANQRIVVTYGIQVTQRYMEYLAP
ncbi:hypothetical protein GCM10019060_34700 [Novosphingobium pokkalii]|nr:hypothetical protein GCM10019060_34700 [Novosphingobium pokkalii]